MEIMKRYRILRKNQNQYSLWDLTNDKISDTYELYQALAYKKRPKLFSNNYI